MLQITVAPTGAGDRAVPFVVEGVQYTLRLRWLPALEAWHAELWRGTTPVFGLARVCPNYPLWRRNASDLAPPGVVFVIDSGDESDFGFADLDTRARFVLLTEADLPEAGEAEYGIASIAVAE